MIELIGRHPDICITSQGLRTGRRDLQSVLDNNCEYKFLEISRMPSHAPEFRKTESKVIQQPVGERVDIFIWPIELQVKKGKMHERRGNANDQTRISFSS